MKKTTDAYEIAYARFVKGRPRMEAMLREEEQRLKLAACLRELREGAGSQCPTSRHQWHTSGPSRRLERE